MNEFGMTLDDREFQELMKSVTAEPMRHRVAFGAKRALKPIVRQAEENFARLDRNKTAKGRKGAFRGGYHGMKLPILVSKAFYKKTMNPFAVVTIRTRNGKTDFRGLFFEKGTRKRFVKDRVLIAGRVRRRDNKQNGYRGVIVGGAYFGKAYDARRAEAARLLKEEVIKEINKL